MKHYRALLAFVAAVSTAAVLLVLGCGKAPTSTEVGGPAAPSSSLTRDAARSLAHTAAFSIDGVLVTFTPTGSMLPLIDSRTVGVAERLTASDVLRVGDVVAFQRGPLLVAHRVEVARADGWVITGGTNTSRSDGWVRPDYRIVALFYPEK